MPARPSVPLYYGKCLSAACLDFLSGSNESEFADASLVQSFTGTPLMCLPRSYHRRGGGQTGVICFRRMPFMLSKRLQGGLQQDGHQNEFCNIKTEINTLQKN